MNVTCEKCQAVFNIDNSLIRPEGSKVSCSECSHIFKIRSAASFSEPSPIFEVIKEGNCPLYKKGDEFQMSGSVFSSPHNKPPCLILVKDIMRLMAGHGKNEDAKGIFSCTGCTGSIQFSHKAELIQKYDNYFDALVGILSQFSLFEDIDKGSVGDIVSYLKLDRFVEGDIILRKGEPGKNLFIILSGRVDVLNDDGLTIAYMGKGDVFGETSIFSDSPVGATIKSAKSTAILHISGEELTKILRKFPCLQMNFIRMLVHRMNEINQTRGQEFASGITGKLSEMPPSDLFQTLNTGQKTGILTLKFIHGSAYVSFREGMLINVRFGDKVGPEAFFELLKQQDGRFKYIPGLSPEEMKLPDIGDFMGLLIEGMKRVDEEERNFLKTFIPDSV